MKKRYILFLVIVIIPFIKVNALNCYEQIITENTGNFNCKDVKSDTLIFKDKEGTDYTNYFSYEKVDEGKYRITPNLSMNIDNNVEIKEIIVSDGSTNATIKIKNKNYVTTTTTTTTTDPSVKELIVTLDPNNSNGEKSEKSCKINSTTTYCNVTLPKLDTEGFNGWGTASTCKEGNIGSIKVEKDITYYACYNNKTNITENKNLYLKSLKLSNKDKIENIDFGTFSIKKTEYSFQVLYEVKNIVVEATADDGIKIEVSGNEDLKVGDNEIVIKLTNENNESNEYKLNVKRLNEGEIITKEHYLKSLVIGGYTIDFKKNILKYEITIDNQLTKLEITAIPENETDTVKIINNENLENNSKIEIQVSGEDETNTTYTINILKEKKSELILYIGIGLISLLIIILIILIIIKKNKKNKSNENIEVLNI